MTAPTVPAPSLTAYQQWARDDFMRYWHELLPSRYRAIERFNHGYPVRGWHPTDASETLEIGIGLGEHYRHEPRAGHYYGIDIRPEMVRQVRRQYPEVLAYTADIQQHAPFISASFDRIVAVHVLEHIPDLSAAVAEMRRLLRPHGRLDVVIPCEGGLAYSLARRVSAQRIFERRYGMPYGPIIAAEHLHRPDAILQELASEFQREDISYWPLPWVRSTVCNLVIGVRLRPYQQPA